MCASILTVLILSHLDPIGAADYRDISCEISWKLYFTTLHGAVSELLYGICGSTTGGGRPSVQQPVSSSSRQLPDQLEAKPAELW